MEGVKHGAGTEGVQHGGGCLYDGYGHGKDGNSVLLCVPGAVGRAVTKVGGEMVI
jgi:hypothetical protein